MQTETKRKTWKGASKKKAYKKRRKKAWHYDRMRLTIKGRRTQRSREEL